MVWEESGEGRRVVQGKEGVMQEEGRKGIVHGSGVKWEESGEGRKAVRGKEGVMQEGEQKGNCAGKWSDVG